MAGKRLDSVQGYRFLLFLAVFLFHGISNWFSIGWGGVMAFLALSSFFLTTKLYESDSIDFKRLLTHRIKRLYPAYLLLIFGAAALVFVATRKVPYDIPAFLLSAQNFFWVGFGWDTPLSGVLGHTWYITLDVYLFILWVLTLKVIRKDKWILASYIGVFVAIIWRVACNLLSEDRTLSYTIPIGQLDSYCIGSIVALNIINGNTSRKYANFDVALGLVGIVSCIGLAGYQNDLSAIESYQFFANSSNYTHDPILVNLSLFVGILSAGFLRLCLASDGKSFLSKRWMVTLGNWSYELYLFHYPFLWALHYVGLNKVLSTCIALPLTILSAFIWHKYAENRIVKLIGK